MAEIAAIIPYFGRLPDYLDMFFDSFEKNELVHLYLVTDDHVDRHPENVTIVPMQMAGFNQLATRKLGLEISIKTGYKLCEFKPAYGLIFQDLISDYSFWACMDLDMVVGDVANQLPGNWRDQDIVSVHSHWLSGPFSIFKNDEAVNALFRESKDWEHVYTSDEFFSFCECGKAWTQVLNHGQQYILESNFDSFTRVILTHAATINAHFGLHIKEKINPGEWVEYSDGRVFDHRGEEFAFYHSVCEKSNPYFDYPDWKHLPDRIYIDFFGFYKAAQFKSWSGQVYRLKRLIFGTAGRVQKRIRRYLKTT